MLFFNIAMVKVYMHISSYFIPLKTLQVQIIPIDLIEIQWDSNADNTSASAVPKSQALL